MCPALPLPAAFAALGRYIPPKLPPSLLVTVPPGPAPEEPEPRAVDALTPTS